MSLEKAWKVNGHVCLSAAIIIKRQQRATAIWPLLFLWYTAAGKAQVAIHIPALFIPASLAVIVTGFSLEKATVQSSMVIQASILMRLYPLTGGTLPTLEWPRIDSSNKGAAAVPRSQDLRRH